MNEKLFYCPLTKLILFEPVLADDGYVYEELAIKDWLKHNSYSPVTKKHISSHTKHIEPLKLAISEYITNNPDKKTEQFLYRKPFSYFKDEFFQVLKNKKYDSIKSYSSFILGYNICYDTLCAFICKNCPNDIVMYVIDNAVDMEYSNNKLKAIQTFIMYSNEEVIKYALSKLKDKNVNDSNDNSIMHYIFEYHESNNSLIEHCLEQGLPLNVVNKDGNRPLKYILDKCDVGLLNNAIKNGMDINLGPTFFDAMSYVFHNASSYGFIKYFIDTYMTTLNEQTTEGNYTLPPRESYIYHNDNLNNKQKQELVYYYLAKKLNKVEFMEDFIDSKN